MISEGKRSAIQRARGITQVTRVIVKWHDELESGNACERRGRRPATSVAEATSGDAE